MLKEKIIFFPYLITHSPGYQTIYYCKKQCFWLVQINLLNIKVCFELELLKLDYGKIYISSKYNNKPTTSTKKRAIPILQHNFLLKFL